MVETRSLSLSKGRRVKVPRHCEEGECPTKQSLPLPPVIASDHRERGKLSPLSCHCEPAGRGNLSHTRKNSPATGLYADSLNVSLAGRALGGWCYATFTVGDHCYIGGGGRFYVMDVSDPTDPTEIGHCYTPGIIRDIHVSGSYAYVADGGDGLYILEVSHFIGIEETGKGLKPLAFEISAHPNPFNSAVTISLDAPVGAIHELPLQIEIFDVNGRMVYEMTVGDACMRPAGGIHPAPTMHEYTWQPDESLGSGVYLVRAKIGDKDITKRVVYLK